MAINVLRRFAGLLVALSALTVPALANEPADAFAKYKAAKPVWLFGETRCPADLMARPEIDFDSDEEACLADVDGCVAKCEKGNVVSCQSAAYTSESWEKARGDSETLSQAFYRRACKLGFANGCTNWAAGQPESNACALETFSKSCALNDEWGCYMVGRRIVEAERKPGYAEARAALEKVCNLDPEDSPCDDAKDMLATLKALESRVGK